MKKRIKIAIATSAIVAASVLGFASPAQAGWIYGGGWYGSMATCQAERAAFQADGWTIVVGCKYTAGYGWLIDAHKWV